MTTQSFGLADGAYKMPSPNLKPSTLIFRWHSCTIQSIGWRTPNALTSAPPFKQTLISYSQVIFINPKSRS